MERAVIPEFEYRYDLYGINGYAPCTIWPDSIPDTGKCLSCEGERHMSLHFGGALFGPEDCAVTAIVRTFHPGWEKRQARAAVVHVRVGWSVDRELEDTFWYEHSGNTVGVEKLKADGDLFRVVGLRHIQQTASREIPVHMVMETLEDALSLVEYLTKQNTA